MSLDWTLTRSRAKAPTSVAQTPGHAPFARTRSSSTPGQLLAARQRIARVLNRQRPVSGARPLSPRRLTLRSRLCFSSVIPHPGSTDTVVGTTSGVTLAARPRRVVRPDGAGAGERHGHRSGTGGRRGARRRSRGGASSPRRRCLAGRDPRNATAGSRPRRARSAQPDLPPPCPGGAGRDPGRDAQQRSRVPQRVLVQGRQAFRSSGSIRSAPRKSSSSTSRA